MLPYRQLLPRRSVRQNISVGSVGVGDVVSKLEGLMRLCKEVRNLHASRDGALQAFRLGLVGYLSLIRQKELNLY